jgi:hypothetical protein
MLRSLAASTILAASLALPLPASGQTTNQQLNELLGAANREVQGAQQDIQNIKRKGNALRQECWAGDHDACMDLRAMFRNPNLNEMGGLVNRPSGAYWPFDPYGNVQQSGRW